MGAENDHLDLRNHPWMQDIDFDELLDFKILPPIIPEITSEKDVGNFNPQFTTSRPRTTIVNSQMLAKLKQYALLFEGFYVDHLTQPDFEESPNSGEEEDDEESVSPEPRRIIRN